ncbi:S-adenosylmethionine mitochondrial carrier protein isoform X7 [Apteryx rowi]|uniref:S-adenosylmethionine mitochondrial carrier protein isoform X7 n=1 Tax=Apteryx rowi TaxID=308060 RepID=UPI000E1DE4A0|nr:S-adenosylmethionine mitochondrial carrier protein isoform X7 [Apteryx rowi]
MEPRESWAALAAGGVAGVCVDLILFPLDTMKTRLQSPQGFRKAGGFRGIYAGVPSTAIGSFPNAAAFFVTYEYVKSVLHRGSTPYLTPVTHMVAASFGEVVACLIRVPSEVIKQRAQVSPSSSTFRILSHTLYHEIPFSLVQFPLWESLKLVCRCRPADDSDQPGRVHLPGHLREDSATAALTQPGDSCEGSRRAGEGICLGAQPSRSRRCAALGAAVQQPECHFHC